MSYLHAIDHVDMKVARAQVLSLIADLEISV